MLLTMQHPGNVSGGRLPIPEQAALDHSQRLIDRIAGVIDETGPCNFADYMEMALYEPALGYYSAGSRKFGAAGDFITAPELSPVFSRCIGRQVRQVLPLLENPVILEQGPGSGVMASDLLHYLHAEDCLPDLYYLLEVSADLRQRQQQLLQDRNPGYYNRLVWLEQLPKEPFNGIILANEVLDALPVRRVIVEQGQWAERCVSRKGDRFCWVTRPLDDALEREVVARLPNPSSLPESYTTEINVHLDAWLCTLADVLKHGLVLFIDYGYGRAEYYHPQRGEGTLLCHYRHHVHSDPFLYPGLQDITASVDFTAVAGAALAAGLQVSGYTTQAHFLVNCGLGEMINTNASTTDLERAETGRQVRMLTMPGEMGERFKVLALTKDLDVPLAGFQAFDQRRHL